MNPQDTSHFSKEFNVIYLRVVRGCNLNCTHCFTLGNRDKYSLAPLEQVEDFLCAIRTNVNPQKAVFYIHGGEPFLAPKDYLRSVNKVIRKVFPDIPKNIVPQTNLMYKIDEEYLRLVRDEYDNHIGVSWDEGIRFSTTSRNLNEELFLKNFNTLVQAGVNLAVAITVQKNLLQSDPVKIVEKLRGARSIDFEFLTMFDQKTKDLKVQNADWAPFYYKLLKYYATNDTTWSMPQADLFTKSFIENKIYQCKCNCCQHRTFTMNVDGSVGLCPDETYIRPFSTVLEMKKDWKRFETKSLESYIVQKAQALPDICKSCEFYDYCGGNCETELFSDGDTECPMSKQALAFQMKNLDLFVRKLHTAKRNLVELQERI